MLCLIIKYEPKRFLSRKIYHIRTVLSTKTSFHTATSVPELKWIRNILSISKVMVSRQTALVIS